VGGDGEKVTKGYSFCFNVVGNDGTDVRLYGGAYLGYFSGLEGARVVAATPELPNSSFGFGFY